MIITKSTHHPTNKKPRLESIKLQSGYETDLSTKIIAQCVDALLYQPYPRLFRLVGWELG